VTSSRALGSAIAAATVAAACGGAAAIDAPPAPTTDAPPAPPPDAARPACTPRAGTEPTRRTIATVPDMVTLVTAPPGDPRLFALGHNGAIWIIADGALVAEPFLDLSDDHGGPVIAETERGLLGLAFHPDYAHNGRFYVYYSRPRTEDPRSNDTIAEYRVSAGDPNRADPATARVLFDVDSFKTNHNGGMLEFGPDGYLYISTGDGGGQGDPREYAQDPSATYGKILRIDVDDPGVPGRPYGIPADNPFAAGGGAPEVFMLGLRNPWRFSIDPATGDFYIGDVGDVNIEELDIVSAAAAPGANFGWDDCEGTRDFEGTGCAAAGGGRIRPVVEHLHEAVPSFNAIIGGAVYRGPCFPDVVGRYFYTDFYAGGLWSFVPVDGQPTDPQHWLRQDGWPTTATSLHVDGFGELHLGYREGNVDVIEFQ
jgi:glucose/arabinose dehydrogenase